MDHVAIDAIDATELPNGATRIALGEAVGTTDVAINHYRLEPDQALPGGLHTHMDQEEIFYVTAGTATFETLDGPVEVEAGEVIRFGPGVYQSGTNRSGDPVTVLAIGAPPETEDTRIPATCPACGHGDLRLVTEDTGLVFACPACGATHVPAACPTCGASDLRMTIDTADRPVAACQGCGDQFEEPPLED